MQVGDKVAIVTGGGGGIGSAVAISLAERGARVVVADLDGPAAERTAATITGECPGTAVAVAGDVAAPQHIHALIERAESEFGPVDMYFANAGITGGAGLDCTEQQWDQAFDINVRAHIRAAQALIPGWTERGEGYFVSTASAAGLLTQIGSAPYAVTKHAALAFAEWLNITYGDSGVRVSCLCPMGVDTAILHSGEQSGDPLGAAATRAVVSAGEVLQPADVAAAVLEAIAAERFLILPHADVWQMYRQKASDYDRWLRGMRRYQASLLDAGESSGQSGDT